MYRLRGDDRSITGQKTNHALKDFNSRFRGNTEEKTMATSSAINNEPVASDAKVDMKFEVIVIPVADVDRSKAFYSKLGWRLDADFSFDNGFRVVQFTPPGSGCSVQFGTKITTAAPGSAEGLYLIVSHEIGRAH